MGVIDYEHMTFRAICDTSGPKFSPVILDNASYLYCIFHLH